jgi:hypothetical protein
MRLIVKKNDEERKIHAQKRARGKNESYPGPLDTRYIHFNVDVSM